MKIITPRPSHFSCTFIAFCSYTFCWPWRPIPLSWIENWTALHCSAAWPASRRRGHMSIIIPCTVPHSLEVLMRVFLRLALLRKVHLGRFVTSAEKEAFLSDCPAKWRAMFHTSLSLHHLHACFKIYDNISLDALKQRMECSEDDCFKCAGIPALQSFRAHCSADLMDCNKTNAKSPSAMIPSVIDQVKVRPPHNTSSRIVKSALSAGNGPLRPRQWRCRVQ